MTSLVVSSALSRGARSLPPAGAYLITSLFFPFHRFPSQENFIKNLSQEVEILNELAKFGIFRADIEGTLWWLQILESIKIPTELTRVARHFWKLSKV